MVLRDWPPLDHLGIGPQSPQLLRSQRLSNIRASTPADILALGLSCVSSTPQLKREWSRWPELAGISRNLFDLSKGYCATTFLSSSLTWPASQSGLCVVVSRCGRTAGTRRRPPAKFRVRPCRSGPRRLNKEVRKLRIAGEASAPEFSILPLSGKRLPHIGLRNPELPRNR
jgi:hypothetical protein